MKQWAGILLACTIISVTGARVIQRDYQEIYEQTSYEWCTKGDGFFLIKRVYWIVDGKSMRNPDHMNGGSDMDSAKVLYNSLEHHLGEAINHVQ